MNVSDPSPNGDNEPESEPALARPHLEPGVAAVLSLFDGPLADQRFPGVDRDSLAELDSAVRAGRSEIDEARAALMRAQTALVERERALGAHETALLARAHRALAYARIYAEDEPTLAPAIRGIELPPLPVRAADPPSEKPEPKRRGRPARTRPGAPLFEPAASEIAVATPFSPSNDAAPPA
ncbi:MAG: hypothetical protein U0414_41915 [Polyangiaceae bacterium]